MLYFHRFLDNTGVCIYFAGRYSVRASGGLDTECDAAGKHPVRTGAQRPEVRGHRTGMRTRTRLQDPVGGRPNRDRREGRYNSRTIQSGDSTWRVF